MPENSTTALVKTTQSPALVRVSSQLALTDKLLTKPEEPFLIPYRKKECYGLDEWGFNSANYWAFCDKDKNIVLEKYIGVEPFINGLAKIEAFLYYEYDLKDHYGFINKYGELVIPPNLYRYVDSFSEGLAKVSRSPFHSDFFKLGFIDKLGNEIIPCTFNDGRSFSEGLAAVAIERCDDRNNRYEEWGVIDKSGKIIIPLKYSTPPSFTDGLAAVSKGRWGFLSKAGEETIPLQYSSAKSFSQNLAAVSQYSLKNHVYFFGFIDKNNHETIPIIYNNAESFSEGLAAVKKGDKWGFISAQHQEIIPFIYQSVKSFSEGLAAVQKDEKWGFVDKSGNEVIPCLYENVDSFAEGRAGIKINDKWGFINKLGEVVISAKYNSTWHFSGKIARVWIPNKHDSYDGFAYIGRNGEEYWEE